MKKLLAICAVWLGVSPLFADNLDLTAIAQIHQQTKAFLTDKCQHEFRGMTVPLCMCVGEKAEKNLDDAILTRCPSNEYGKACVARVVQMATAIALTKEVMNACNERMRV